MLEQLEKDELLFCTLLTTDLQKQVEWGVAEVRSFVFARLFKIYLAPFLIHSI